MARQIGYVYLPLDVEFMDDDRVAEAGERAGWLYLAMCLRSKQLVSDGKLSPRQVERLGIRSTASRLAALVRVGLVEKLADGRYYITGWEKHNSTAAELLAERERSHQAAVLGNHRRWHEGQGKVDHRCEHCTSDTPTPPSGSPPDRGGDRGSETGCIAKTETETETETETRQDSLVAAPAAPRKGGTTPRKHRLPEDFPITAQMVQWARDAAPLVDGRHETEQWRDYHLHKGDTGTDWTRSWQTWMRRAQKDAERRPGGGQLALVRPARPSASDAAATAALEAGARVAARHAAREGA